MNIWSNAVITTAGLNLLAKLIEGNSLNITRAVSGSGFVTPGLLLAQTSVTDIRQELSFVSVSYPEDGKCAVKCRLSNTDLDAGYTAMQVGFYATDPDDGEILFFIAQAAEGTGTPVPSNTEMGNYTAEWTFYFQYGHADGVTVIVDPSASITRADMEDYAVPKIHVGVAGGVASLDEKGKVPASQIPEHSHSLSELGAAEKKDLDNHVNNKNNPHGVTASQIGARPDTWMPTAADVGAAKRTARFTVGTSTNGWTLDDCDYLCDGSSDQTEINNAIAALPSTGGEVVLLDGTYNVGAPVKLSKNNVTLRGNGTGTKLVRAFTGKSSNDAVIKVVGENCVVRDLSIDGAKATYTSTSYNYGISVDGNNNTIEGTVVNDNASYGIYTSKQNVIIKGNRCSRNLYGIYMSGEHCTVTENVCNNNTDYGINLLGDYNIITGNVARFNGERNISLYSSSYNVVSNNNVAVVDGDSVVPSEYALLVQDPSYSQYNYLVDNIVGIGAAQDNSKTSILTKTPKITKSATDITAGSTALREGESYHVYE